MNALNEFANEISGVYGIQCEIDLSILTLNRSLIEDIKTAFSGEETLMFFGMGDPNQPEARVQYFKKLGELRDASANDGRNMQHVRRTSVAYIYSQWEVVHRAAIAHEVGIPRNEIKSPVIGDLKNIRHAILHAGGRLDKELSLKGLFDVGDKVAFSPFKFHALFVALMSGVNQIATDYYQQRTNFLLDYRIE